MKQRHITLAAALAAALTLTLAACGEPGGAEAQAGAGEGDEIRFALGSAVGTLSVFQEAGIANYHLAALSEEGLTALGGDGELEGAIAESWSTEDLTTWVFDLRDGVTFHDGTPVTPKDVLFSLDVARDPELAPGLSTYWPDGLVVSAEATGPAQVTIVLDGPHADFAAQASAAGGLFVVPQAFWEQAEAFGSPGDLVRGTGPYEVVEFDPASHVSFEKYQGYWGDNSGPAKVRVDFITDDAARLLAFQDGSVDVSLTVPPDQAASWESVADAQVAYFSDRSYQGLTFDAGVEPFDDVHVRRAVAHAVDKDAIVRGILLGHGQAATGIDNPVQLAGWVGLEQAEAAVAELPAPAFSLEDARAELAQSSVPDGFAATLTYPTGYPAVGKASLAIAQNLAELGVTLDVKEIPLEQWLSEVGDGAQGVAWMIYGPTTPVPNEITGWLLAADGPGANPANWEDAGVAATVAGIGALEDPAAQFQSTLDATAAALQQAVYAPVYWGEAAIATGHGVAAQDFGSYTFATNWARAFVRE
ncbi:MAG: ABC transporter substrate-binding protein [Bifidobacteriaceae bacterium]|jgi:peptide/nickel transport system substrate-binding protein|nr:ABC transporter substrate-binding protein [Bifidobacteriaceae bacterium]